MKLETILNAAKSSMIRGHHKPHCDDSPITQLDRRVQNEIDNIGFAPAYAEPGYTDPKVILAKLHALGKSHAVLRIASKGQFDITWEAFYKGEPI